MFKTCVPLAESHFVRLVGLTVYNFIVMNSTAYIFFEKVCDLDCDYIKVGLHGLECCIFDIRSLAFLDFLDKSIASFDGVLPSRYMVNIPATKDRIPLNAYDNDINFPCSTVQFAPVCKKYIQVYCNKEPLPDLIKFIGMFLTDKQKKLCGL